MLNRFALWLPWILVVGVLAWSAVVFWASVLLKPSAIPIPVDGLLGVIGPMGAHFGMYGLLSALLLLSFADWRWFPRRRVAPLMAAAVISSTYGALMEVFQGVVPGRHMSFLDMTANTIGAFVGVAVGWIAIRLLLGAYRAVHAGNRPESA
ncbi:MAG: VanZ family protein [Dehalococcoidia bacterium]